MCKTDKMPIIIKDGSMGTWRLLTFSIWWYVWKFSNKKILKTQGMDNEPKTQISVEIGEQVRITSGSFENCIATVTEINEEKGTVKGLIDMFGRETVVEVDYSQIEKSLE